MKERTPISLVLLKIPKKLDSPRSQKLDSDEPLLLLEAVLRRDLRYQDQFLRYQDNALVGILAETDEVGAKFLQKRVLEAVHLEQRLKEVLLVPGTATYPEDGENIQSLLKVAEARAMGQSQTS